MMNMYGSTGMGAAGTGMPSGGMAGGSAMSPQLMAMLQAMQQSGQGQSAAPMAAGPMQGGAGSMTPMSAYIGAGGNAGGGPVGGMGGGAPMPQQSPQQSQPIGMGQALGQAGQQMAGGAQNTLSLMQTLQNLKGMQTGVPANGAAAPTLASTAPSWNAQQGAVNVPSVPAVAQGQGASWLQSLLSHIGMGGGGGQ